MTATCRYCQTPLSETFVNLGSSPLANSYLTENQLTAMEPHFELHPRVCNKCFLVQLQAFETPENIFSDYAYFSSYSDYWLAHCRDYSEMICHRLKLDENSLVVELASNDGYLLQYFKKQDIPVLGVEPAANVAAVAMKKGIPSITDFFGVHLGRELGQKQKADLIIGNNVLAHVPDINDFVGGMKPLLKPGGVITMEFPYLVDLIQKNLFDTIYHEHFSYLSLFAVDQVFEQQGLRLFDVEKLTTHGGSLRIYACHLEADHQTSDTLKRMRQEELEFGINTVQTYRDYDLRIKALKRTILQFLIDAKNQGKTVAGYGAPAKCTTLFSYCGIGPDFIDFTVDRSPHKQNKYLPGSHIFIDHPDRLRQERPDYIIILPWNIKNEIADSLSDLHDADSKFVTFIPEVEVW